MERIKKIKIIYLLKFRNRYLSINRYQCLVGNSSAGIRDAGFIGTPVVNIGTRQNDREHGNNVINSNYKKDEIYKKILITLKKKCKKNILYGDGTAAKKIIKILKNIKKINIQKKLNFNN